VLSTHSNNFLFFLPTSPIYISSFFSLLIFPFQLTHHPTRTHLNVGTTAAQQLQMGNVDSLKRAETKAITAENIALQSQLQLT
jgi:hypothetical protein